MAKPAEIIVKIRNWDKFNPRKDVKNPAWFRLNHDLFDDPDFYGFTHSDFIVWIYLLTLASKKNGESFTVNSEHCHRNARVEPNQLHQTLKKLSKIRCIETRTLRGRYANVTFATATNETDERNETNVTRRDETPRPPAAEPVFDFESVYREYPRKIGKDEGIKRARQIIRTPEDFEGLRKATRNYADYCREMKTEERYILHFSTFIEKRDSKPYTRPWRDYIERKVTAPPGEPPLHPEIAKARALLNTEGAA